jgi:hypothetical protein
MYPGKGGGGGGGTVGAQKVKIVYSIIKKLNYCLSIL